MNVRFHEALREARLGSRYSRMVDFARIADLKLHTYKDYESGRRVPQGEYLEQILQRCGLADHIVAGLRDLHAVEIARQLGVEMRQLPPDLNVSELSEKIQREVDYELKRARIRIKIQTRKVCVRRIEMLLKDALRLP